MTEQTQPEARFLDLDALAPEVAVSIRIKGEKYEMAEMSVADFVWAQKLAGEQSKLDPETIEEDDTDAYESVMGSMIDLLARQFPTCPREDIATLPITKLSALIRFTGNLGAEGAEAAVAEAAEEGKVTLIPTEEEKPTDQ